MIKDVEDYGDKEVMHPDIADQIDVMIEKK